MREYILYMWVGAWLLLVPFFGVPGSWKDGLVILTALFIIMHSFIGYRRSRLIEERDANPEVVEVDIVTEEHTELKA